MDKVLLVGYGNQGKKREREDISKIVGIVDPKLKSANYKNVQEVPLSKFDIVYLCCPDQQKKDILTYLVKNKKHVLVEKPLFPINEKALTELDLISKKNKSLIYVAYNHRFEPNILDIKKNLKKQTIGDIYYMNFFYGNGTSLDILNSPWRNEEKKGVFQDLGCHIFDLINFFDIKFNIKDLSDVKFFSFETKNCDYCQFNINSKIKISVTLSNLSWKNQFYIDCVGERGSIHAKSLCKWGIAESIVRKRVYPSGIPKEKIFSYNKSDSTWSDEIKYFKSLINKGIFGLDKKELFMSKILNSV